MTIVICRNGLQEYDLKATKNKLHRNCDCKR